MFIWENFTMITKKNGKNNVIQFKIKFTILLMKQSIKRYLFAKYLYEHFK